ARNLSRWVDGIAARVFAHSSVETMAREATIPVVNGLSDFEHPCQALADYFTLWERGLDPSKTRLAWVGDGNNVCHSVMLMGAMLGARVAIACPPGYEPDPAITAEAGAHVSVTQDVDAAARGADVIYTDVWTSMGQEAEAKARRRAFQPYQVNERVVALARPDALVMHCLPAHRGEEITDAVIDGAQSVVFDQAENRLHVQKAIMCALLDVA
ncbi:MAG TPA: ornithine carbamoyltransferase, partial [Candidatus Binatia bacterium]|nr:ornithine carbamoyltransferase [Candidatus Binatia bacterium]